MDIVYDIAIIGAGAVGCAIARELSRYELGIVLIEANSDVGMGTSKASTAIWHTGYDATPGTLESALLKRSYPLIREFMKEVGSPFELVGGLLIAIGLMTDWAAFIASGEMAAAYFMGHAAKGGLNPLENKGELAVVYCFLFLFMAGYGSGIWSVDAARRRR